MNELETVIEKQKKMSNIVNNLMIELQYIQTLAAQVFGKTTEQLADYDDKCITLSNLCDTTEVSLKNLKCLVPVPGSKDEPKV